MLICLIVHVSEMQCLNGPTVYLQNDRVAMVVFFGLHSVVQSKKKQLKQFFFSNIKLVLLNRIIFFFLMGYSRLIIFKQKNCKYTYSYSVDPSKKITLCSKLCCSYPNQPCETAEEMMPGCENWRLYNNCNSGPDCRPGFV